MSQTPKKPPSLTLEDLYPRTHTATWRGKALTPENIERMRLLEELREQLKAEGRRPRKLRGRRLIGET